MEKIDFPALPQGMRFKVEYVTNAGDPYFRVYLQAKKFFWWETVAYKVTLYTNVGAIEEAARRAYHNWRKGCAEKGLSGIYYGND
jgi:hypothetical protein